MQITAIVVFKNKKTVKDIEKIEKESGNIAVLPAIQEPTRNLGHLLRIHKEIFL